MQHQWTIFLILVLVHISYSIDLLDEYVKHVEESSKYQQNINKYTKDGLYKKGKKFRKDTADTSKEISSYFKYTEELNQNEQSEAKSSRSLTGLTEKRDKRDVYKVEPPRSTIQKAFGNRQTLKKLIQTAKSEKKPNRSSKRNKRSLDLQTNNVDNFQNRDDNNILLKLSKKNKRSINEQTYFPKSKASNIKKERHLQNKQRKHQRSEGSVTNFFRNPKISNIKYEAEPRKRLSINEDIYFPQFKARNSKHERAANKRSARSLSPHHHHHKRKRDDVRKIPMRWTHQEVLDDKGDVVLKWQPRHQEIAFRLEVRTTGLAAVGFSSTGEMKGSDVVVGWIDDTTRHAHLVVSLLFKLSIFYRCKTIKIRIKKVLFLITKNNYV